MSKIHIQTYGCSLNHSDSEVMQGVLLEAGHELVKTPDEADLLIINSCTVKSNPEQRLFYQIRNRTKPLVVAGCVPQADRLNEHFSDVSVIGTKALSRIADVVEDTLAGKVVCVLDSVDERRNTLPHLRSVSHIEIIPINAGCLSNCSYCKTKHARGGLESYPLDEIEKQFRTAVNDGVKEVWLTSQDTAAYGLDIKTDIVALLERLVEKPGDYRIRVGMGNPQFLLPRIEKFISIMKHPNVFSFVHIPVQSGSDTVLKDMRRGYTTAQFRQVTKALQQAIPDITIATDIIVGFPSETQEDFEETLALIEELNISVVNISKFYPRPDTPAAKMKLLATDLVKVRSTRLKKLCEQIASKRNASYIGQQVSVIVDEVGKKEGSMIARADNYVQVIVNDDKQIGQRVKVAIASAGVFDIKEF